MGKRVVVVAEGETDRRAIPYLVEPLKAENIVLANVRRPNGHKALTVEMAEKLIKAEWYAVTDDARPDKFIVLLDTDGKDPDQLLRPFRQELRERLGSRITATLQFAYAQRHLEAWYFADSENLRRYLGGRDLGSVDASQPDQIQDPKRHLKSLLGNREYTIPISEQIASQLRPEKIAQHSPSFRGFLDAVRDGGRASAADTAM